jgi:Tol biopolymer transport system component
MLPTRFFRFAAGGVLLAALLAACDGGPGDPGGGGGGTLTVATAGRLERGNTIQVTASGSTGALAPGSFTVSVQPAGAAEAVGADSLRLLATGPLTITAAAGLITGNTPIVVLAPPTLVFDRLTGGNRDIFRVDLDGANLMQLTTDPGDDQDPTAVKGSVVFVSYRGGNGNLYAIPLAGGATTTLTTTTRDEMTPALSADGQKLAFSAVVGGVTKVFTANSDASSPVQLVAGNDPSTIETAPSWSLGGSVAFVSTLNGSADIFQASTGGTPALLIGGGSAEVEPAVSPNGQTLAFVSNRNGGTDLFTVPLGGGAPVQLTSGPGSKSQPAWTPDGRLVYLHTEGATTQLRWIDPAAPSVIHSIATGTGTVGHPAVNQP